MASPVRPAPQHHPIPAPSDRHTTSTCNRGWRDRYAGPYFVPSSQKHQEKVGTNVANVLTYSTLRMCIDSVSHSTVSVTLSIEWRYIGQSWWTEYID